MSGKARALAMIVVLSVAGLLALAGWAAETPDQAAQIPEIPAEAKTIKNPAEATPESIANGKQIYTSQCAMCHGVSGDGKGDLAIRFKYAMADFRTAAAQSARTDGEWFHVLTHGHGKMSGEGDRLSQKVRWDLVNYLRSLGPKSGT